MSIQALNWALERRIDKLPAKLLLIVIANRAGFDNECWPSIRTMMRETGMSRSSVKRWINWLVIHNFITRTQRRSSSGDLTTSMYVCNLPVSIEGVGPAVDPPRSTCDTPIDEPTLNPKGKIDRKGLRGNSGKQESGKRKPRHGQRSSDRKRVWFDHGTEEWAAYAANYAQAHVGMAPEKQWNDSGSWFNYLGEAAPR